MFGGIWLGRCSNPRRQDVDRENDRRRHCARACGSAPDHRDALGSLPLPLPDVPLPANPACRCASSRGQTSTTSTSASSLENRGRFSYRAATLRQGRRRDKRSTARAPRGFSSARDDSCVHAPIARADRRQKVSGSKVASARCSRSWRRARSSLSMRRAVLRLASAMVTALTAIPSGSESTPIRSRSMTTECRVSLAMALHLSPRGGRIFGRRPGQYPPGTGWRPPRGALRKAAATAAASTKRAAEGVRARPPASRSS